ncbi:MAG: DUF2336 domain-containing protein, partial [Alphaproteobacteria bacterium]
MSGIVARLLRGVGFERRVSYEDSKRLARTKDVGARRQLAANRTLRPEMLYFLADDPAAEVRREIAANPKTPVQADLLLAHDRDDGVRHDLAHKIARLAPDLDANGQDEMQRRTVQVLEILARDQLAQIRRMIADAVKDLPAAPTGVIRVLASDAEIEIAGPVLQFSPLLGDSDLLEIIASDPIPGALSAIARRHSLAEPVAESIAGSDNDSAVAALLANKSAQIREETLDALVGIAPRRESWHAPLVRRPKLSATAVTGLAGFVARSLIDVLQQRTDLDQGTARALAEVVESRLAEAGAEDPADTPEAEARRLRDMGALDEDRFSEALDAGDREFIIES